MLFIFLLTFFNFLFSHLKYELKCSEIIRSDQMNETYYIFVQDYEIFVRDYFNVKHVLESGKHYEMVIKDVDFKIFSFDNQYTEMFYASIFCLVLKRVKLDTCIYYFYIKSEVDLLFDRYSKIEMQFKIEKEMKIILYSQDKEVDMTQIENMIYLDCVFISFRVRSAPCCIIVDFDCALFVMILKALYFLQMIQIISE